MHCVQAAKKAVSLSSNNHLYWNTLGLIAANKGGTLSYMYIQYICVWWGRGGGSVYFVYTVSTTYTIGLVCVHNVVATARVWDACVRY